MDERGMRFPALVLVIGAAIMLLAGGCGGSSDVSGPSAAPASLTTKAKPAGEDLLKERRRQLRVALRKLENRNEACNVLSDHFLDYNYGAPGRKGRHRCQEEVQKLPPSKIRSYRILVLKIRTATVKIVDTRGTTVKVRFVFDGQRCFWTAQEVLTSKVRRSDPRPGRS